ncbi:MAG TPA: signal peptidase I [Nocardioidaceae bacterium]|nr:signal peptidase I [Nocardioidaceae bacterium]
MLDRKTACVPLAALVASMFSVAACGLIGTKVYRMPSSSMEPTLRFDESFRARLVEDYDPRRLDVVVFEDPGDWLGPHSETSSPSLIVKRVIGIGGDHVVCCDSMGRVQVNGDPLDEDYIGTNAPSQQSFDVTVPSDHLWVMGDNRASSADSRAHIGDPEGGFVPVDLVRAIAQLD